MKENQLLEILRESYRYNDISKLSLYPQDKYLLDIAFQHDVGLLVGNMMKLDRQQRLANRIIEQKNLKRYYENFVHFGPVADAFEKSSIQYVITKGVYAAKTAYINEGLRRSDDLDVIINRDDYSKVKNILQDHGYIQGYYDPKTGKITKFTRKQELFYLSFTDQSAPFVKKTGDDFLPIVNLDINFQIFWDKKKSWNIHQLLNNFQLFNYKGMEVRTFSDEFMLIHMCLHAYYDMNSIYILYKSYSYRLKYFVDIYGFIKRGNVSWKRFRDICRVYKIEKYVMYIFYYTSVVFNDESLLTITELEVPDSNFLRRFGLDSEGTFTWEETFMERLFSSDRSRLLNKYLDENLKTKIAIGSALE